MIRISTLLLISLIVSACGLKLVKDEKYISTEPFKEKAMNICMASKQFASEPAESRAVICKEHSSKFVDESARKFREYKADEHTFRLCRSKFGDVRMYDKCFREKQANYYERDLAVYKKQLNK